METITYKLDQFEGPLDLLLSLIDKNKVSISDIPISLICDQYMAYLSEAKRLDMDIASEFIVMASELMLIKSKMLLPRPEEDAEDPRAPLADALLRYKQAKEAVTQMGPLYEQYSGRMIKDTDEITVDKKDIRDQNPEDLFLAIRRLVAMNASLERAEQTHFTPLIQKPIVSVELKILGILDTLKQKQAASLYDLLKDSESRADLMAAFLGVLELIKIRKVLLDEDETADTTGAVKGLQTLLRLNPEAEDADKPAPVSV